MSAQQDAVFYVYENNGFQAMTPSPDAVEQAYENMGRVSPTINVVTKTAAGWGVTPDRSGSTNIYMPETGIAYAYDYIVA